MADRLQKKQTKQNIKQNQHKNKTSMAESAWLTDFEKHKNKTSMAESAWLTDFNIQHNQHS